MDDFQKDFINKVKNPTLEGEVVGSTGTPKKPIDKRWFIIIGLILILIITLIVLLIISNTNSNSSPSSSTSANTDTSSTTDASQSQGDPVSANQIQNTTWTCADGSTMAFDSGDGLIRATAVTKSEYAYSVSGSKITFGKISATLKNSKLTILYADNKQTSCTKEQQ